MNKTTAGVLLFAVFLGSAGSAHAAQESWSPEQRRVLDAMERLSAATAPGGAGPEAYAAVLDDRFSRWTLGASTLDDKASWLDGVREWWAQGWRVANREVRHVEIVVRGTATFSRRVVTETYVGPDGEQSTSTVALAEVWRRDEGEWLLLRVDVHPLAEG